ncbi:AAA family ATPase [Microbacterium sp. LWO14-1.2]|uniref:AAA family ATPase n=1 Tax=Microbacterium sp. LWO14-1.2 TaxID=3135263 RepID=UPI003139E5F5
MARVLVTGMSGVGKSTVVEALSAGGVLAIDTDHGEWKVSREQWDLDRVRALLDEHEDIVVAGTVENQGLLYDVFDHVVLLSAPTSVMIERIARRHGNPYGKTDAERQEILEYTVSVEPLLRATATAEIDTTHPVAETVERIRHLLHTPRRFT